mgnify:CR=1 FL=1
MISSILTYLAAFFILTGVFYIYKVAMTKPVICLITLVFTSGAVLAVELKSLI